MHPMLNTAIKAARRAGTIINRASLDLERLNIARKGPRDYVTEVDRAAEESIIDILRTAYPDHGILAEESGLHPADGPEPEFLWVVDPLDGTTNFIHGFAHYAVSIALMHRGQAMHGVIFDPTRNEMFTASRGSGAFLNDRRVRVSSCHRYGDALLASHVPRSTALPADSPFICLLGDCASARRTGSTVLDLAWVAGGRLDGFCGSGLKPWDMAAGSLLVLEAGGLMGDYQGEQGWMQSGNVLAANPRVFARFVQYLKD
ncbi:inositol monophosphatase family protein [Castellaniella sp.]|uniref:inositol monophosphatase family protein n=1 Tax=Castellaniella sp. TaxID=1955812 RepID=UPI003569271D